MEIHLGCGYLNDSDFVTAFEQRQLKHGAFHHADHIRLAWLYVTRLGPSAAEAQLLTGIQKMTLDAGVPQKFLYTTTVAWTRLVAAAHQHDSAALNFSEWIQLHPQLLDRNLLAKHYSVGRLETPEARSGWIEPDLAPLGS